MAASPKLLNYSLSSTLVFAVGPHVSALLMLTPRQTERIQIILAWTKHFRTTAKKHDSKWWRFGRLTLDTLDAIRKKDTTTINRLVGDSRGDFMFLWAINYREKKVVCIDSEMPYVNEAAKAAEPDTDYIVFAERYDPDYINFPYLTFYDLSKEPSFQTFDHLFEKFLAIKTDADFNAFNTYLNHYPRRSDES